MPVVWCWLMNSYENEQTTEHRESREKRRTEERTDENQTKEGKGGIKDEGVKNTNENERWKDAHSIE